MSKNYEIGFVNEIKMEHSLQADIRSTICLVQTCSVDLIKEDGNFNKTKKDIKEVIENLLNKL